MQKPFILNFSKLIKLHHLKCRDCHELVSKVDLIIESLEDLIKGFEDSEKFICTNCSDSKLFNRVKIERKLPKDIFAHIMQFCSPFDALKVIYMSKSVLLMFNQEEIFKIKLILATERYYQIKERPSNQCLPTVENFVKLYEGILKTINEGKVLLADFIRITEIYYTLLFNGKGSLRRKHLDDLSVLQNLLIKIRVSLHLLGFEIPDCNEEKHIWEFVVGNFYENKLVISKMKELKEKYRDLNIDRLDFNSFFGRRKEK